jgi:hypothetical protein
MNRYLLLKQLLITTSIFCEEFLFSKFTQWINSSNFTFHFRFQCFFINHPFFLLLRRINFLFKRRLLSGIISRCDLWREIMIDVYVYIVIYVVVIHTLKFLRRSYLRLRCLTILYIKFRTMKQILL